MIDISKNELYIVNFDSVSKDYIPPRQIPFCRPRRCDGLIYILGGSCNYCFSDGRRFTANTGDILYLSKGSVYEMKVCERYDFICINFFFGGEDERQSDVFKAKDASIIENLFYRAWRTQSGGSLPAKMSILYKIYNEVVSSRELAYLSQSARAAIDEAIALISASSDESISVKVLAKHAGMSEVYFRKLFKSAIGVSPAKFMINCKTARAKELLSEDYLSLEEIAERCGFSSLSYFCRVFKSSTGMTPGEFRSKLSK